MKLKENDCKVSLIEMFSFWKLQKWIRLIPVAAAVL
jgi:hypothetical protein